jgi:glycosyltransferase involved in cell wall biosynthesis
MAPAISKLLEDERLRNQLIAKGHKQARKFTWEKTARETLRVLERVGRGSK